MSGRTIIEIEVTPAWAENDTVWWRILWDGTRAVARSTEGLAHEHPCDWGIPYVGNDYTDAWHAEGGTPYVIEQLLDGFKGHGAQVRIVTIHGNDGPRQRTMAELKRFADAHPQCAAELRRFVQLGTLDRAGLQEHKR